MIRRALQRDSGQSPTAVFFAFKRSSIDLVPHRTGGHWL